MKLLSLFKKKDPQKFPSKKLQKVINNAIKYLDKSPTHYFPLEKFSGCGVYVLYYNGMFYDDLLGHDCGEYFARHPIYVGKAVPTGWRSGRAAKKKDSRNLWKRINEHARNIEQVENLNIKHFECKYVILDDDLIVPVEAKLIRNFKPLWNCSIDGFGNHFPGNTRLNQARPDWDILHPGRSWAENMGTGNDRNIIIASVRRFIGDANENYLR
jgi:hypothetical protein